MSTSVSAEMDVESWYRSYATRLRYAARRILGNREDAEDATQEAFLAAYRARARYDGSDPYPWLHRIATRKALNIASARRSALPYGEAPFPATRSAEDEALERARDRIVRDAVLGEPDVALHLLGGLHFREIGQRLGMPLATAGSRVRRGKLRLRSHLAATLSDLLESNRT